jgi:alpha-galactosidase
MCGVIVLTLTSLLIGSRAEADTRLLVSQSDASVVHDSATDGWTIGARSIAVTLGMDSNQALVVRRVLNPLTARILIDAAATDTTLTLNGRSTALAEGTTGLHFEGANAANWHGGVQLTFTYRHPLLQTDIVRHYACYPGSPTIETWTTVQTAAGAEPVVVSHLVGWQISVPVGTVRWINGLRGDAPDTPVDDAFSVGRQDLAPGESLTLAAHRRSSERFMPFVMIDNGSDEWFGGVQWSGMWRITCTRIDSAIHVALEYPDTTTTVTSDHPLEMPHSFVGSVSGGPTAVSGALRGFLTTGVRLGRPIFPLVTYNTWYPYGTRIDEPTMLDEIERTASLGVELFVLDAGWYPRAGALGFSDFESGLGTWAVDETRFPNGLRALADRAHDRGMKFGFWVEPGRVSLATVGMDGLAREEWLAQRDGVNVTPTSGQLCYGSRAAREWVRQKLFALIDAVHPDYLKWDNNAWINCNRDGHDHGHGDGNLAQVQGLYTILDALRERYPNLLIENVADGGSRIDFGILRYSDAAWMDDRTSPPMHVRHNLEGLSSLFPPGYLLSFVLDDVNGPLAQSSDPIADIRSGMFGVLGFAYRSPGLRSWLSDLFAQAITDYRGYRDILQGADAVLLGEQAPGNGSAWDAVEALNASTGEAVLFAFQQANAYDRVHLYPRGLLPDVTYAVRSLDTGDLGTSRGDALMEDGIEIVQGSGTQAHILVLRLVR